MDGMSERIGIQPWGRYHTCKGSSMSMSDVDAKSVLTRTPEPDSHMGDQRPECPNSTPPSIFSISCTRALSVSKGRFEEVLGIAAFRTSWLSHLQRLRFFPVPTQRRWLFPRSVRKDGPRMIRGGSECLSCRCWSVWVVGQTM